MECQFCEEYEAAWVLSICEMFTCEFKERRLCERCRKEWNEGKWAEDVIVFEERPLPQGVQ